MSTVNKDWENRYLESPHMARGTSPGGQMPFRVESTFVGGVVFTKKGFSTDINNKSYGNRSKWDIEL